MVEFGDGDFSDRDDGDDDDIARFERQCAERARAEGLLDADGDVAQGAASDDEDDPQIRRARIASGFAPDPGNNNEWAEKCQILQEKLARREAELAQARADLDLLRNDSAAPGEVSNELKQRLLELTKKNRRLQVKAETQKTRILQLENEVKKPREEVRKQAEELSAQTTAAVLGDGMEDWKNKYLYASNKLQEARHDAQDSRAQLQRHKKVLLKELGSEDSVEKALAVADDPAAVQWKGRATQITQLQRQVRELKEQIKKPASSEDLGSMENGEVAAVQYRKEKKDAVTEKERKNLEQVAEKRREEFDRLQEEADKLRTENADLKKKREALKGRTNSLEGTLRDLKAHVQTLVRKSDNDDQLVNALRRQLGRHGSTAEGGDSPEVVGELDALRDENVELQDRLDRQAQIVLQLRQKTLAATCEAGSVRLGPQSVESAMSERQLVERVRYLEAENAKLQEQVRLLREQLGEDPDLIMSSRPYSAKSR